jgi:CRP-like cAMP-binding protein
MVVLSSIQRMSPALKKALEKGVYPIRLNKGEIINTITDHFDGFYFVEKGMAQLFRMKKKEKMIFRFTVEDQFIISIHMASTPISERKGFFIEALEDCIFWHFSTDLLQQLYDKYPEFNMHGQIIVVQEHALMEQAHRCSPVENSRENYYNLCRDFPYLLDRVPIPNLANFTWLKESVFRHLHAKKNPTRL